MEKFASAHGVHSSLPLLGHLALGQSGMVQNGGRVWRGRGRGRGRGVWPQGHTPGPNFLLKISPPLINPTGWGW